MTLDISGSTEWDQLQEPKCNSGHSANYLRLLAALDSGWDIHLVRSQPDQQQNKPGRFYFTLRHAQSDQKPTLLIPWSQELEILFHDKCLI
jgi:hypothetical protein